MIRRNAAIFLLLPMLFLSSCANSNPTGYCVETWAIEPKYIDALPFSSGVAAVKLPSQDWCFISTTGADLWGLRLAEIISPRKESPSLLNGVATVVNHDSDEREYIFRNGKVIPMPYARTAYSLYSDTALVVAEAGNGKYGYLNNQHLWFIPPEFDAATHFSANYSIAENWENKTHIGVNAEGDITNLPYGINIRNISDSGMMLVRNSDGYSFFNSSSELIAGPFEEANFYNEGYALVSVDDKYGFIDKDGTFSIKPQFIYAQDFNEGVSFVRTDDGTAHFIDYYGQSILSFGESCQTTGVFHNGSVDMALDSSSGYGLMDTDGNWIITPDPKYTEIKYGDDGIYLVKSKNLIGMYYSNTDVLIPPKYDAIYNISNSRAVVVSSSKYGIIDTISGEVIVKPHSLWFYGYSEGLISAQNTKTGKFGYLDLNGQWAIEPKFQFVGLFRNSLAPVQDGGLYGYILNPLLVPESSNSGDILPADMSSSNLTVSEFLNCLEHVKIRLASQNIFPVKDVDISVAESDKIDRLTAAKLATSLAQEYGIETRCYLSFFEDVNNNSPFYNDISFSFSMGLFGDDSNTMFYPDKELKYEEFELFFSRLFECILDKNAFIF